jgi:hypothetical protein
VTDEPTLETAQADLAAVRAELAELHREQERWAEREARLRKTRDRAVKAAEALSEALATRLRLETAGAAGRSRSFLRRRAGTMTTDEAEQVEALRATVLFDAAWYLRAYADVVRLGEDPALHFLRHWSHPFRRPTEDFDTGQYVLDHPEVLTERINPLIHFLMSPESDGADAYPPRSR